MSDHVMLRRVAAAQATLDEWRDRPFRWGHGDCVRLVASHLRRLGHKVRLPASGSYSSPRSALRALRARGFETVGEALDAMGLERIAPAAAVVGDVMELPSANELAALVVVLSNGRALGYHPDAVGAVVMQPVQRAAAWRIIPL